jgi:TRAP-type C4-dicarboxylate transport system permease small subunit
MMEELLKTISGGMCKWMEIAAGIVLIAVMLLIGSDIIGRIFGCPIPGTYEIVSLAGGLILGLALPATSRAREHVSTDLLLGKLTERLNYFFWMVTRLIGIGIFILAGYGTVLMGVRLGAAGEVTAVLALPFHYIAYAIGGAFSIQALVLFSQMFEPMHAKE